MNCSRYAYVNDIYLLNVYNILFSGLIVADFVIQFFFHATTYNDTSNE